MKEKRKINRLKRKIFKLTLLSLPLITSISPVSKVQAQTAPAPGDLPSPRIYESIRKKKEKEKEEEKKGKIKRIFPKRKKSIFEEDEEKTDYRD
jgi:hypothetical protein